MTATPLSAVERSVRKARRRLVFQRLVNAQVVGWSAALAVGLGWVLAEPWVLETPPDWLRWAVLGGAAGVATIAGILWAVFTAPTREVTALEVDTRFGLKERVTTALYLRPDEQATPAGRAVLADAQAKVSPLAVGEKFPVRPRPAAAFVPVLAGAIALAVVFYQPDTGRVFGSDENGEKKADDATAKAADPKPKAVAPFAKPRPPELAHRPKGKDLEQLEEELDKMMEKWSKPQPETPEKAREKVTELTKMEDKVKKFNQEKYEKLAQLEKQLQQLDRLNKDKEFADGPAKEFSEALSKGDLKKADEAIDELKKKVQDKKLDQKDLEKLDQQIEKMKEEMKKSAKDKEKEQKLKEMIQKAKADGRDAEALERELSKLQDEAKQNGEMMDRMAERMQKMQQAIKKQDLDDLASELEKMSAEMKDLENELQDLEDSSEYLQKLKEEMKKACKACSECEGEGRGPRKDFGRGRGIGEGEREIDRNAKTASGSEERIRGLFDPRGRKQYGGSTRGPAFTKRSDAQMGEEIKQAAQEAPGAPEIQRLPRDAQESVREYFKKLGGTENK